MPFGGVGASGYGKYHGKSGFDVCSHYKPVLNKYALNFWPFSARYPPLTENNFKTLNLLFRFGDINQSTALKFVSLCVLGVYFMKNPMFKVIFKN